MPSKQEPVQSQQNNVILLTLNRLLFTGFVLGIIVYTEIEIIAGHIYEGLGYVNELAMDWFFGNEVTNQLQDR